MLLLNKKEIFEIFIIVLTSIIFALVFNYFSPNGIALLGEWDTNKGVISAVTKKDKETKNKEITLKKAKELYNQNFVFVDARDLNSYNQGHIKNAVSFPYYQFDRFIDDFIDKFPLETNIVTYCTGRECRDSINLAHFLYDAGYENIFIFIDGFLVWKESGMPCE